MLTYANTETLDPFDIVDHLGSLKAECLVAQEDYHETEGQHMHVYVCFDKRPNFLNERVFDINGFHPNVGAYPNAKAIWDYVTKEGNIVAGGAEEPRDLRAESKSENAKKRKREEYERMEECNNIDEADSLLRQQLGFDYFKCGPSIQATLAKMFPTQESAYKSPDGLRLFPHDILDNWYNANVLNHRAGGKLIS